MAEAIYRAESAPVILPNHYPPMPAVARVLARFDRDQLNGFIAVAIDLADAMDGDPDVELNGDELDGNASEDDFMEHEAGGSGCPVADPGGCEHDGREPDHDAERETWSHWMDHPAELHIGNRPGLTD